jgi:hypothetical protein
MKHIALTLSSCSIVLLSAMGSQAAPKELYGKSIIVSWGENRIQREVGEASFRSVSAQHEFRVYISTAGRLFSRLTNSTRRGAGSRQEVGGAGATRVASQFQGQTMTLIVRGGNHARQISANFDGSFSRFLRAGQARQGARHGPDDRHEPDHR